MSLVGKTVQLVRIHPDIHWLYKRCLIGHVGVVKSSYSPGLYKVDFNDGRRESSCSEDDLQVVPPLAVINKPPYQEHLEAMSNGGPCPICGWCEGDGVKLCFPDPFMGKVMHQNTDPWRFTPPAVKAAWQAWDDRRYLYVNKPIDPGIHQLKEVNMIAWDDDYDHTRKVLLNGMFLLRKTKKFFAGDDISNNLWEDNDAIYSDFMYEIQPQHNPACLGFMDEVPGDSVFLKCNECGTEVHMEQYGVKNPRLWGSFWEIENRKKRKSKKVIL